MNIGTELDQMFDQTFFPATKDELLDYAIRSGASWQVIDLLNSLENDGDSSYRFKNLDEVNPVNHDLHDFFPHDND